MRLEAEIEAKQRRFEWRMRPAEISKGKGMWCGLMCALGLMEKWNQRYVMRKKLHKRSQKVLKFLLLMAITVGKICRILRKKRRNVAFAVLKKLIPFVYRWHSQFRRRIREKVGTTTLYTG
jgi:nitrate reductase gamma subunit